MSIITDRQPSYFRTLLLLCAITGTAVAALGISLDRNVAEKIGTALMMPTGILWILLLTLCLQLWRQKRQNHGSQPGTVATTVCLLLYSIAGNGFFSNYIVSQLEADYLTTDPLKEAPVDMVIVLGGGGALGANGRSQANFSGDRLILAAQLYHNHITNKFICTGQRIATMNSSGVDPAETSRDILVKLGVPESAIEISDGQNTSEEMIGLGKRFGNSNQHIGVLTSAWHLTRAMRLAERNGIKTVAMPADFRSASTDEDLTTGQIAESMIPNSHALYVTCSCVKECLGMLVRR